MKHQLIIAACLALAACAPSAGRQAEDQYRIVAAHGNADEKCAAARSAEAAYLTDRDAGNYEQWSIRAGLDCNEAMIERSAAGG